VLRFTPGFIPNGNFYSGFKFPVSSPLAKLNPILSTTNPFPKLTEGPFFSSFLGSGCCYCYCYCCYCFGSCLAGDVPQSPPPFPFGEESFF